MRYHVTARVDLWIRGVDKRVSETHAQKPEEQRASARAGVAYPESGERNACYR